MFKLKKLSKFICTLMLSFSMIGVSYGTEIIAVFHAAGYNLFWATVIKGFEEAGKDLGVDISYLAPSSYDVVRMSKLIDSAVNQNPKGLIVSVPDEAALSKSIKRAVAAGIPVITVNSGDAFSKSLGALLHIGQNELDTGRAAGKALKAAGVKHVLCVNHEVGNVSLDQRCQGLEETVGSKVTILSVNEDPADVESKVKAKLSADNSIDGIFSLNAAPVAPAIIKAINAVGKADSIKFGSADLSPQLIDAIKNGSSMFGIDQQPYLQGYMPVVIMNNYIKYGIVPTNNIASGPLLITKSNVASVEAGIKKGVR